MPRQRWEHYIMWRYACEDGDVWKVGRVGEVLAASTGTFESCWNALEEAGWQLVCVNQGPGFYGKLVTRYYFKRPVEE